MGKRSRIFNICAYECNEETGEHFTEENIRKGLRHKSIKNFAYIFHDKDVKPSHWHIVMRSDRAIDVDVIARWFGIRSEEIDTPKGRGSFLDCVECITHGDDSSVSDGKHRYDDSEVKSNFNFRAELDKRKVNSSDVFNDKTEKKTQKEEIEIERKLSEENKLIFSVPATFFLNEDILNLKIEIQTIKRDEH